MNAYCSFTHTHPDATCCSPWHERQWARHASHPWISRQCTTWFRACSTGHDAHRPGTVHLLFTLAVALAMADFEDAHMRTRVMGATQVLHEGHITAEKFLEHLHARLAQKLPPRKPTSYSQSPGSYGRITR